MSETPPSRASFSGAEAQLDKLKYLDAQNKELQDQIVQLQEQLKESTTPKGSKSSPRLRGSVLVDPNVEAVGLNGQQMDKAFDSFCRRLHDMGINSTGREAGHASKELFQHVQQREVQLSKKGVRLLQEYSVVRVYLLANIGGTERCLIEHDRFDLTNGKQKTLMLPLELRMRGGEDWKATVRRGLQTMVGLEPAWQDDYIVLDESSHICNIENGTIDKNPLGFLVAVEAHEVHGRIETKAVKEDSNDTTLEQVGLPSGRDFVYCEENRQKMHVWCWKSREHETNARMKAFEKYLNDGGVNTSSFGTGNNKTLFRFYEEAEEQKICSLLKVAGKEAGTTRILRVVRILKIKLIAEVSKRKKVLMENEQFDAAGKRRAGGQLIIRKLREGEDWQAAVSHAITERIGLSVDVQAECFSVDAEKMTYTEEEVPSKGFAGIMSKYMLTTVPVYVIDTSEKELECIGLPRGNDFVSKEFSSANEGGLKKLHVWSWVPAVDEEDAGGTFGGTALEELTRGLYDVEHLLTQTIADPQMASLGLDMPFKTSLQKLKHCGELLSNIDQTLQNVDVGGIMGDAKKGGMAEGMSGLKEFIEATCVRGDKLVGNKDQARGRQRKKLSVTPTGGIYNSASVPQKIMDGRNEWGFDFFAVAQDCESPSNLLQVYGEVMLSPLFCTTFKSTEESAQSFVAMGASLYQDNPYHGPLHAVQVSHLARWLTKAMRIMDKQSELEGTAFIIAAFCHDIKHIGRNNNFCVQSEHPLALLYNNSSVLENFHSSSCLELLEKNEVLKQLPLAERSLVRSHIIDYILATDMAEHFETISKFRVRREAADFSADEEKDRRVLARLCLKAGDLGHGALPWNLHLNWSEKVAQEFYEQGDEETRLGLTISALCARKEVDNLGKSQNGFLNFVVSPLYNVMSESQIAMQQKDGSQEIDTPSASPREDDAQEEPKPDRKPKRKGTTTELLTNDMSATCLANMKANCQRWQEDAAVAAELRAKLLALAPEGSVYKSPAV